ncbi:MAG TPA: gephyrin-like molybdotransferase Glp [Burkholderiaceae bacterium]
MRQYEQAGALTVTQSRDAIRQRIEAINDVECAGLGGALGRVLAEDIVAPMDVPAADNSAMDGYALPGKLLEIEAPLRLKIAANAFAGHAHSGLIGPGECIAITTGALLPQGCDTVVPQELALEVTSTHVTLPAHAVARGANRRLAGEDLQRGALVLSRGKILRPADIGLLASLGIAEVTVSRRLRVAFFSTGDELRSIGDALDPGCVYDSNRYTLHAMLTRLGCEVIDLGVVRDDPDALEATLRKACAEADAIVTSGGVSVGAADYTRQIMAKLGAVDFWKIAMRPGRPMAFGRIASEGKSAYLFGLPGNPVAVMVSFYMIARDALLHLAGAQNAPLPLISIPSRAPIRKLPGRTEFQRGFLVPDEEGRLTVSLTGPQGSGILRSMSEANCMVVLAHERGDVQAGEAVDVMLFDGLI